MELKDSSGGADDDRYVIFKQDDLFAESFPLMKEIRRQGKLCDVTLKVNCSLFCFILFLMWDITLISMLFTFQSFFKLQIEDQSFSAHRIVLASTIPYFYAMFTHNLVESRIKEIEMKEIEPQ